MDCVLKEGLFWGYDGSLDILQIEIPGVEYSQKEEMLEQKIKKLLDKNITCGIIIMEAKQVKSLKVVANKANTRLISITLERKGSNKIQIDL